MTTLIGRQAPASQIWWARESKRLAITRIATLACARTAGQEGMLVMPNACISRRAMLLRTGRVAGTMALVGGLRALGAAPVAAQTPPLSRAGAASVTAGPGAAAAHGAAADAVAAQGRARAQAAAAVAGAASGGETTATGAVAVAVADPAHGAAAQGAVASADATRAAASTPTTPAASSAPARSRPRRVRRVRGGGRAGRQQRQQRRVKTLPATGTGRGAPQATPWLALGSTLAAAAAFIMRRRAADPAPTMRGRGGDGEHGQRSLAF